MKPDLRSLTLYEAFIHTESRNAYTKAIGLVPVAQPLPQEYDKQVRSIFNGVKTASDIVKDPEIMEANRAIEKNLIEIVTKLIKEGDQNGKPVEFSVPSMKKFLTCYEQLRNREKHMIEIGYPEKLLNKGKKIYGPLIKTFATRSHSINFQRRSSLFNKSEIDFKLPSSPPALPKKPKTREREVQTEPQIRKRIVIADKAMQTESK